MESPTDSISADKDRNNLNITVTAFYIMLGLLGLLGNAFVGFVMLRYRHVFNSTTNKLIIHQSMVDFTASMMFFLHHLQLSLFTVSVPDNFLGIIYCRLWWSEWALYGVFVTSTYNLVAISLERYFATCQPVKHRNMFSTCRLKGIMATSWVCGFLSQSHLFALSSLSGGECVLSRHSSVIQALEGLAVFLVELLIPLTIVIFAYVKIILELHKRSRARIADNNQDARNMLSKANKNVTKTLLLVAIFFAVCWIPKDVNYILFSLGLNDNFVNSDLFETLGAVVVVNMCINPVIYCFTYDHFQKQAKRMVAGGCRRSVNQVGASEGSGRLDHAVQSAHQNATVSIIHVGHILNTV